MSPGRAKGSGKLYVSAGRDQGLWAYQQAVKEAIGPTVMMEGNLKLTVVFWRNLPETKIPGQRRTRKGHAADGTNLTKALEDALQGVLYKNDSGNVSLDWHIAAQGPDVRGRILVGIEQAPAYPEILNNLPEDVYVALREEGDPQPTLLDSLSDGHDYERGDNPF